MIPSVLDDKISIPTTPCNIPSVFVFYFLFCSEDLFFNRHTSVPYYPGQILESNFKANVVSRRRWRIFSIIPVIKLSLFFFYHPQAGLNYSPPPTRFEWIYHYLQFCLKLNNGTLLQLSSRSGRWKYKEKQGSSVVNLATWHLICFLFFDAAAMEISPFVLYLYSELFLDR